MACHELRSQSIIKAAIRWIPPNGERRPDRPHFDQIETERKIYEGRKNQFGWSKFLICLSTERPARS
jgi:hypothetical protein